MDIQLFFCGASVFEEIIHHLMILKIMTLIAAREKKREFDVNLLKQIFGAASHFTGCVPPQSPLSLISLSPDTDTH